MAAGTAGGNHTDRRGNSSHGDGVFTAHPTLRSSEGVSEGGYAVKAVWAHSGSGFMRHLPYIFDLPRLIALICSGTRIGVVL
jgi:hypothetical protein